MKNKVGYTVKTLSLQMLKPQTNALKCDITDNTKYSFNTLLLWILLLLKLSLTFSECLGKLCYTTGVSLLPW